MLCPKVNFDLSLSLKQCGLFKRWRNFKKLELTEETDGGFAYHHRAIPPIPGLNHNGAHSTGTMKEEESVGGASDKERETEAEAEMELEIMTRVHNSVMYCHNIVLHLSISLSLSSSFSISFHPPSPSTLPPPSTPPGSYRR